MPDYNDYPCADMSYRSDFMYYDNDCISPYAFWVERCYYQDENGGITYVDHEYRIDDEPLSDQEKRTLNIQADDSIVNLECYRLLHNGEKCDILLFCNELDEYNHWMEYVYSRVIYAYSISLQKTFTAHRLYFDYFYAERPVWAPQYSGVLSFPCLKEYIGVDDKDKRTLCSEEINLYVIGCTSVGHLDPEVCNYDVIFNFAFTPDKEIWLDYLGIIDSKYGRLGIKDVDFPTENLVHTQVVDCTLGVYDQEVSYKEWVSREYDRIQTEVDNYYGYYLESLTDD